MEKPSNQSNFFELHLKVWQMRYRYTFSWRNQIKMPDEYKSMSKKMQQMYCFAVYL
jgi:hypothetical protein